MPPAQPTQPVPLPLKSKVKQTTIETINNPTTQDVASGEATSVVATADDGDDEEELPELTPALLEFSKIAYKNYDASWKYIQNHSRELLVPGATDALLVEAFSAQRRGKKKYAKQCVHQGLLLQYCEKLGPDGVSLFFKRCVNRIHFCFGNSSSFFNAA